MFVPARCSICIYILLVCQKHNLNKIRCLFYLVQCFSFGDTLKCSYIPFMYQDLPYAKSWLRLFHILRVMVFNATFNNISVISWLSVLLVEETNRSNREKTTDLPQVTVKLYHIMLYRLHLVWARFELTPLMLIGTDCTGSCKSNYYTITTHV